MADQAQGQAQGNRRSGGSGSGAQPLPSYGLPSSSYPPQSSMHYFPQAPPPQPSSSSASTSIHHNHHVSSSDRLDLELIQPGLRQGHPLRWQDGTNSNSARPSSSSSAPLPLLPMVESPSEDPSRSDTEEPYGGHDESLLNSSGQHNNNNKRKSTDDMKERLKKKRNRAVLSCVPCKSRKIKCDRKLPCESCVRRGISEQCHWEDTTKIGAPQPFATVNEVEDMRSRLEYLEAMVARIPQGILEGAPEAKAESDVDGGDSNDGEEAAVGALESLALGHHHPDQPSARGSQVFDIHSNYTAIKVGPSAAGGMRTPYSSSSVVPKVSELHRTQSTIFLPVPLSMSVTPVTEFLRDLAPSNAIRNVMKALPRREVAETLIDFYFKTCEWMDTTVSERDFRRECADLWDHLDKRRPLEAIDPAWLAVLFVKLATSARQLPTSYLSREDPAVIAILPDQFYMASKRCLELADWMIRPQFRVLQTLCTTCSYVWFSANRNEGLATLAVGMRLAQIMGLGNLGEDQMTMPVWEDLAFPSGPSVLKRQLCCRIWTHLGFMDNTFSSIRSMTVFYPICGANTANPLNVNDDDLHTTELTVESRPLSEHTDMTYFLLRNEIVTVWRFIDSDAKRSYDEVLAMDKQIRKLLSRLPMVDAQGNIINSRASRPTTLAQRSLIQSGLSSQLVRLHSNYFFRSYRNPKFAYSHEVCLSAAASVLDCNLQVVRNMPGERFWFLHLHAFSATMCLLLDLMHSIDSDAPDARLVTEERMRQADMAIEIFQATQTTSRVPTCQRIGRVGVAICRATVKAARERHAHRISGDARAQESYADTFRRIMATVANNGADVSSSEAGRKDVKLETPPSVPASTVPYAQPTSSIGPGAYTAPAMPSQHKPGHLSMESGTQDVLRNLGISLDHIVEPSPASSHSSNHVPVTSGVPSQNLGMPWAPDSVFDDLFGSNELFGQQLWDSGNF